MTSCREWHQSRGEMHTFFMVHDQCHGWGGHEPYCAQGHTRCPSNLLRFETLSRTARQVQESSEPPGCQHFLRRLVRSEKHISSNADPHSSRSNPTVKSRDSAFF